MAPNTLNNNPCQRLEGEVTALEAKLHALQNRLGRLLDPHNPPSKAVLKLQDEIASFQESLQTKQTELTGCRARHH